MTIPDPTLSTFRDLTKAITPRWLQKSLGFAHKLLYTFALHLDLMGDAAAIGVRRRLPGYDYDFDAHDLTGRDRKIRRGRLESNSTYAARQARWLDDHRVRGNAYAMLAQIHAHYAESPLEESTIDGSIATIITHEGMRYKLFPDASVERDHVTWDPDGLGPTRWPRWWLGLEWPAPVGTSHWDDPGLTWDDGRVWDLDLTPQEVADLRLVPREWGNSFSRGTIVLVPPGEDLLTYNLEQLTVEGNN